MVVVGVVDVVVGLVEVVVGAARVVLVTVVPVSSVRASESWPEGLGDTDPAEQATARSRNA